MKLFCRKHLIGFLVLLLLTMLGISLVGYAVAATGYVFLACFVSSAVSLLSVWAFALLVNEF